MCVFFKFNVFISWDLWRTVAFVLPVSGTAFCCSGVILVVLLIAIIADSNKDCDRSEYQFVDNILGAIGFK